MSAFPMGIFLIYFWEKELYLLLVSSHVYLLAPVKFRKNSSRIRCWTTLSKYLKTKEKVSHGVGFLSSTQNGINRTSFIELWQTRKAGKIGTMWRKDLLHPGISGVLFVE